MKQGQGHTLCPVLDVHEKNGVLEARRLIVGVPPGFVAFLVLRLFTTFIEPENCLLSLFRIVAT